MSTKKLKPIKAKAYKEPVEKKKKIKKEKVKETVEKDYDLDLDEEYIEKPKKNILSKITNIIFIIIVLSGIIIAVDVVRVYKYKQTPIFAIKTNTFGDGGTKEYYGIGYKVYKYNVTNGRSDIQIGLWNLKYSITPSKVDTLDLAIEFETNKEKTAEKYYNHYIETTTKVKEINNDINELVLEYTDPDKKYTFQIKCIMNKDQIMDNYMKGQDVTVKGIVGKFVVKDEKTPNKVYLKDCTAYDTTIIQDNVDNTTIPGDVPGDLPDPNTLRD